MKEQERIDLEELKGKIVAMKISAIEYMLFSKRNGINHTGYKSLEDLYSGIVNSLQKNIDNATKDYIRKYPDEGIR